MCVGTSADMSVVCSESWPEPDYHLITRLSEWCPGLPSLGHPHWLISGGRINLGLASSNSGKYAMMWDWWNIRWGMSQIVRTLTPESRWDWQRSHTIWCHNYKHGTSNYYDESFVTKVTKKLENSKLEIKWDSSDDFYFSIGLVIILPSLDSWIQ